MSFLCLISSYRRLVDYSAITMIDGGEILINGKVIVVCNVIFARPGGPLKRIMLFCLIT